MGEGIDMVNVHGWFIVAYLANGVMVDVVQRKPPPPCRVVYLVPRAPFLVSSLVGRPALFPCFSVDEWQWMKVKGVNCGFPVV